MKKLFLFMMFINLVNCSSQTITNNIDNAIKLIENEYATKASYKLGTSLKLNKNVSFIEIKVEGGDIINSYNRKFIPISNIAVLTYEKTKTKFDEYRIELVDKNNESTIKHFSLEIIELFIEKRKEFELINNLILNKEFNLLHNKFDSSLVNGTSKDLSDIFKDLDDEYGKCKEIIIHGFINGNLKYEKNDYKYVAYFGIIKREGTDNKISVFINQETNEILSFKLDW